MMSRARKIVVGTFAGFLFLCLAAACLSAMSNQTLPSPPTVTDRLSELDKARLAETMHLKQSLGDTVWPGWSEAEIPFLVWNNDTSFLLNYPGRPTGWEVVPDDEFLGDPYFRQPSEDPQNFAVEVDGRWTASMATKWETDAFIIEQIQNSLPPLIRSIVPYRLFIMPSEVQMTGLLHEAFHVYQSEVAPEKLAAAEDIYAFEEPYFQMDLTMDDAWQEEIQLLRAALDEPEDSASLSLVQAFLDQRNNRRISFALDDELIAFEQLLEWEEGLAKYVELAVWQTASHAAEYEPRSEIREDSDFNHYNSFDSRWSQEMRTMKNLAGDESLVRFYYTGMVQARLLDRHYPGWKEEIMGDDVWLETMLRKASDE